MLISFQINYSCNLINRLTISTLTWEKIPPSNDHIPNPVDLCSIAYYNNSLYLTGGYNSSGYYGYFFQYSFTDKAWTNISTSSFYYVTTEAPVVVLDNYLYVIMGVNGNYFVNSIWKVNLDDNQWVWTGIYVNTAFQAYGFLCIGVNSTYYIFGGNSNVDENSLWTITSLDTDPIFNLYISSYNYPSPRADHTLKLINENFLLFGGIGYNGYYQDLWEFNIATQLWTAINTNGNLPSARHLFASDSFGDALLIWGGEDINGLNNDMYIYNTLVNFWTKIIPTSPIIPAPRKGACAIFTMPYVYIFGGETQTETSSELWQFTIGDSQYLLISNAPLGIAYANCQLINNSFIILLGQDNTQQPLNQITIYNFTTATWIIDLPLADQQYSYSGTQAISLVLGDMLLFYGGRILYLTTSSLLQLNYNGTYDQYYLDFYPYNMAFAYYKTTLYFHGGGSLSKYTNMIPQIYNNVFGYLDIKTLFNTNDYIVECSAGTTLNNSKCILCPAGSYSDTISNSECTKCPPGTYNRYPGATCHRQCYPCPSGTFNIYNGSNICYTCPSSLYCLPGSLTPTISLIEVSTTSEQPSMLDTSEYNTAISSTQLLLAVVLFPLSLILLATKFRIKLKDLDMFADLHNYEMNVPIIKTQNTIGGAFTLFFYIAALILLITAILTFSLNNLVEVKSLQPLVVLNNAVSQYYTNLKVTFTLVQYAEVCRVTNAADSLIKLSYNGIILDYTKGYTFTGYKDNNNSCIIIFACDNCYIDTAGSLSLVLSEESSFAAGIFVNVTSSSSIPNSYSYIQTGIYSASDAIFVGPIPTTFYFLMTPSFFKSSYSGYPSQLTGYHVALDSQPVAGSENIIENLIMVCDINILVYLNIAQSGLYTYRYQAQTFVVVISALLGSIAGITAACGAAMKFFEKKHKARTKKRKHLTSVDQTIDKSLSLKDNFSSEIFYRATDSMLLKKKKALVSIKI